MRVCLGSNTHDVPCAGGHLWAYLNWALGLRDCGAEVIWLEQLDETATPQELARTVNGLRQRLRPFGLDGGLAVTPRAGEQLPAGVADGCLDLSAASECDLLLDVGNKLTPAAVSRFRRSALIDIDPGILQLWVKAGRVTFPEHDLYFTIGETVGASAARFPDCGVEWHYVPPPVHLTEWSVAPPSDGPYTTVSSWWGWWEETNGRLWDNQKRAGFLDYLHLPRQVPVPLELALGLWGCEDHKDVQLLVDAGWRVRSAFVDLPTPADYRDYVRSSRAEFSCAKPSCARLQNAWVSDRTLCYLATGRPAIVQHTGVSRLLPDAAGIFRFRNRAEAVGAVLEVERNYDHHARQARALAEEIFDARRVVASVLERALP